MNSSLTYIFHTITLTRSELAELMGRSRALVGLFLYVLIFAGVAYLTVTMQRDIGASQSFIQHGLNDPEAQRALQDLGIGNISTMLRYLNTQPFAIWIFQFVSILWYPIFITILSFDCIAADIQRGTQRFVIQRTSRASYLSSKFLAHFIFYALLHLLALALMCGACAIWLPHLPILFPALRYGLIMLAFILLISCATVFVSSACRSAGKSLVWIHLFWIVTPLAGLFIGWLNPLRGDWLIGLMMPDAQYGNPALIGFSVWSVSLVILALLRWEWRDL